MQRVSRIWFVLELLVGGTNHESVLEIIQVINIALEKPSNYTVRRYICPTTKKGSTSYGPVNLIVVFLSKYHSTMILVSYLQVLLLLCNAEGHD